MDLCGTPLAKHCRDLNPGFSSRTNRVWLWAGALAIAPFTPAGEVVAQETYRDEFTMVAYNGTNGTTDWSTSPWVETDVDGGGASGGRLFVDICLTANCLRIRAREIGDNIYRQADLTGALTAALTYNYDNDISDVDVIRLEASGNGGGSWTTLRTYSQANEGTGSESFDITAFIASNTRIRFFADTDDGDRIFVDDVQIAYTTAGGNPGSSVTPDGGQNLGLLPSNGTNYVSAFTVNNDGTVADDFGLRAFASPGGAIAIVSVNGVAGDTTEINLAAGASQPIDVIYSIANVVAGVVDSLILRARAASFATASDTGFVDLTVVRPDLLITKTASPSGTQPPGTDLTYTVGITNTGTETASGVAVVDSLPAETHFEVGSVVNNLPAGIGVTVEYSSDAGATWIYAPASGACGAQIGHDGCVTHIRWVLQNDLSSVAPDNTGTVEFVARIV